MLDLFKVNYTLFDRCAQALHGLCIVYHAPYSTWEDKIVKRRLLLP